MDFGVDIVIGNNDDEVGLYYFQVYSRGFLSVIFRLVVLFGNLLEVGILGFYFRFFRFETRQ